MSKAKKSPKIEYGIEITKPWSKEMYDHNDKISKEMKKNIIDRWENLSKGLNPAIEWEGISETSFLFKQLVKLQKGICYSGYGSGYSFGMVDEEFRNEVEHMPNWQLHESYSYLAFERLLPKTSFMLIGFEWQKFDYHIIGSQEINSPNA